MGDPSEVFVSISVGAVRSVKVHLPSTGYGPVTEGLL